MDDQVKSKDFPDLEHVKTVCRIGQGADCCRYLTMHPDGWSCEKHSSLRAYIDYRANVGSMHARSDNCPGKDAR
jgi:hypothetical protein